jgi:hypothetical protein
MRKSKLVGGLAAAMASMVLVLPPPAAAQQGGGGGTGDLYSDLVIALRDVNGVPIPTTFETAEGDVACVQPISYTPIPNLAVPGTFLPPTVNGVDGRTVYLVPLMGELPTVEPVEEEEEVEPCDPQPEYADYVSEVELERLNLVRTDEAVLWRKLSEVGSRLAETLAAGGEITLDGAGRITTQMPTEDAIAIDAAPEQAAIYAANQGADPAPPVVVDGRPVSAQPGGLMDTGTIPYWTAVGSPPPNPQYPVDNPAQIDQGTGGFDYLELAAAAVGTAASKFEPITIDAIPYYNRVASKAEGPRAWDYVTTELGLLDEAIVDEATTVPTVDGEEFIDYSGFEYNRSEVFRGCTTWLDVPTLTWKTDYILNRVDFIDLVEVGGQMVPGTENVAGFAQLADDVRSMILYLHENEVVVDPVTGEGFFLDPVFTESCEDQMEMRDRLNLPNDAVTPTVTITAAPTEITTATDATFAFTTTGSISDLCVLDSGAIERCLSPKTYAGLEPGTHTFTVIAMGEGAGNFVSATHTWTIVRPGEDLMITPLTPVRFADTRPGWIAADRLFVGTGPVPAGGVVQVQIAGRGAVPVGAKAVVANVTLVNAAAAGFATVFPCGTVPDASSVNYLALTNEAVANEVIAKLSPTGSICVYTSAQANVLVDVAGYVPATSDFVTLTPVRLADTRPTPVAAGAVLEVPVAGRGGVPADAKAVVANVTLVNAAAAGFATVFPCGTVPDASSVNYLGLTNEAVANEVIAKLSPTGSICVYTSAQADVLVDVAGYVPATSDYMSLTPVRLADTRPTPVAAGGILEIPVAGRGGVPADATAVVANVTLVNAAAAGFATVFPCGTVPDASTANYRGATNEAVANEVIAKLSPTGSICVYTYAASNVLVDVVGHL